MKALSICWSCIQPCLSLSDFPTHGWNLIIYLIPPVSRGVHFGGATMTEYPRDIDNDNEDDAEEGYENVSESESLTDDIIKEANLFPYQVRYIHFCTFIISIIFFFF